MNKKANPLKSEKPSGNAQSTYEIDSTIRFIKVERIFKVLLQS